MSHSDDIPVVTPYAPRVEKTPAAVREALDPDWRAEFEAGWRAALDQAKETFDLDPAHEVVIRWWPRAQLCQVPGAREEKERVEREFLAAGHPVGAGVRRHHEIRAADGRITL
ncbi:DUF6247 family protein [Carbonactinospora thermoautotrophica]|uniref:DUF6247 family protein n=1 Tax=Carbonactinospora thermoautotrophica TaxID=1469144 RepID=UPI00083379CA|nr:DUF6247 family protein [Carbonactinospora thermoautotrophica]